MKINHLNNFYGSCLPLSSIDQLAKVTRQHIEAGAKLHLEVVLVWCDSVEWKFH